MSHNYLLDLSQHIDAQIASLAEKEKAAAMTSQERCRTEGRLAALRGFQSLLCREFFPKLPKRLYLRLSTNACEVPQRRDPKDLKVSVRDV